MLLTYNALLWVVIFFKSTSQNCPHPLCSPGTVKVLKRFLDTNLLNMLVFTLLIKIHTIFMLLTYNALLWVVIFFKSTSQNCPHPLCSPGTVKVLKRFLDTNLLNMLVFTLLIKIHTIFMLLTYNALLWVVIFFKSTSQNCPHPLCSPGTVKVLKRFLDTNLLNMLVFTLLIKIHTILMLLTYNALLWVVILLKSTSQNCPHPLCSPGTVLTWDSAH